MSARALVAAFMAVALGAAGPYAQRLSPQERHRIKTVAVISAVGHSFLFQHVRETGFEWLGPPDSHLLEISDWALDPLVTTKVTTALAKSFAVKPIAFQPADFSSWNYALLRKAAFNLNDDPAIDAYVLILRDWTPDEIGYSNHALGGLGLYRRDGRRAKSAVFASYRIVVVDALKGEIIASHAARLRDGTLPVIPSDPSLWPKTPNDLTDAQRATLAADETKLIDATLPRTLNEMGLAR